MESMDCEEETLKEDDLRAPQGGEEEQNRTNFKRLDFDQFHLGAHIYRALIAFMTPSISLRLSNQAV